MAKNQTRRIPPTTLAADQQSFQVLQGNTAYAPANAAFSLAETQTAFKQMQDKQTSETQAQAAADAARDAVVAAEWEFHNLMLGVKTQVAAQFGEDSDELNALGLKKKSEYKSPARRSQKPSGTT